MKEILNESTVLYVEDDIACSQSVSMVFNNIFKKVYIASDGQEALDIYNDKKNEIDVIISDINMPILNGLDLLKIIREEDPKIPFVISSAYTDAQYLLKSIELNVTEYITKPIDIKKLLEKIAYICEERDNTKKLALKEQELSLYLDALNKVAIVSKTDLKGKITYVNDIFCEVAQYTRDELIGKAHSIVRHPDTSKLAFKQMWDEIQKGNDWQGKIKNLAKDGSDYHVNATIFPLYDNTSKQMTGYIAIRFLTTDEENNKREFKKKVLVNIKENKVKEYELGDNIKQLNDLIEQKDKEIREISRYLKVQQVSSDDLKEKILSKDRQLTHYELQMENVDKRIVEASKSKTQEIENYISINQQLKNDKEVVRKENKKLERTLDIVNQKNELLKNDNIKKIQRLKELEDVVAFMEENKK